MQRFQNILVGVDLSDSERLVTPELSPSSKAAVDQAIWLAKQTGAKLTISTVLMPCLAFDLQAVDAGLHPHLTHVIDALRADADRAMKGLVEVARAGGVEASYDICCGTGWIELCRQVTEKGFDLLIVGSHKRHMLGRIMLGSTGNKLLRKCPCPVWVVSPHHSVNVRSVLVATDFTEASDLAVELAKSLAERFGAQLHLLHAVEYPHMLTYKAINIPAEYLTDYRFQVYREAKREFDDMLARYGLTDAVSDDHRHLVSAHPDNAILDVAESQNIDLVVMGSVGRSGLMGMLMGNTAESVLSKLKCSVLAVKPSGFVCPLKFAEPAVPAVA